jgi:hypothetical protein
MASQTLKTTAPTNPTAQISVPVHQPQINLEVTAIAMQIVLMVAHQMVCVLKIRGTPTQMAKAMSVITALPNVTLINLMLMVIL